MRGALVMVVLGMVASTARADPFDVRNPVPDAPPSASTATDHEPTNETIDPGHARRRAGVLVASSAIVFWGTSFAISYAMAQRFKVDVMFIDERVDVAGHTADADRALDISRTWGTGLFAAGAVAVGVGAYLYFRAPAKFRREHVVVPAVGSDTVGVSWSSGF